MYSSVEIVIDMILYDNIKKIIIITTMIVRGEISFACSVTIGVIDYNFQSSLEQLIPQ